MKPPCSPFLVGLAFALMIGCAAHGAGTPAETSNGAGACPCTIAPPEGRSSDVARQQAAKLEATAVGVGVKANYEDKAAEQIKETFSRVPDRSVACQMLFQTITCITCRDSRSAVALRLSDQVDRTCSGATAPAAQASPTPIESDISSLPDLSQDIRRRALKPLKGSLRAIESRPATSARACGALNRGMCGCLSQRFIGEPQNVGHRVMGLDEYFVRFSIACCDSTGDAFTRYGCPYSTECDDKGEEVRCALK